MFTDKDPKWFTMEHAKSIITYFGMPWRDIPEPTNEDIYSWDGEYLNIPPSRRPTDLLHELGHWVTAINLTKPEYGLGANPYENSANPPTKTTIHEADDYEIMACDVQLRIMHELGLDWLREADILNYPNASEYTDWLSFISKPDDSMIPLLQRRGLWSDKPWLPESFKQCLTQSKQNGQSTITSNMPGLLIPELEARIRRLSKMHNGGMIPIQP